MKTKSFAAVVLSVVAALGYAYGRAGGAGGHSSGSSGSHSSGSGSGHSSGSSSHSSNSGSHSSGSGISHSSTHSSNNFPGHSTSSGRAFTPTAHMISRLSGFSYHTAHAATGFLGARDASGRIIRNEATKREFMQSSGYQHGRPGYVVAPINPLKTGGTDTAANMEWQSVANAKARDRWQ